MRGLWCAALALAGCAAAPADRGPPIGAAARAHTGAAPLATPPPDIGNAEDPVPPKG